MAHLHGKWVPDPPNFILGTQFLCGLVGSQMNLNSCYLKFIL